MEGHSEQARRQGHTHTCAPAEEGIRGNTHFPMSDLNNVQIADHPSKYLRDDRLD